MTQRKCANFSCPGLGDGLVSLVLSNNMHLNGWQVVTYHQKNLSQLQPWFPHLPILSYPQEKEIDAILAVNDKIFVSYSSTCPYIQMLIEKGKMQYPEKLFVLNPSYSSCFTKVPYYADAFFSPHFSIVSNIAKFCRNILHLEKQTKSSGIIVPYELLHRKYPKRVVIHPTGSRLGKCWDAEKFVKLALHLKSQNFSPVFVMSLAESYLWEDVKQQGLQLQLFSTFDALAKYIYESGFFIGNDSGIGHLASALGLPTLSLFRNFRMGKLWRPDWSKNSILYPPRYIPNISGLRLRDKKWQKFISVRKVVKKFMQMVQVYS